MSKPILMWLFVPVASAVISFIPLPVHSPIETEQTPYNAVLSVSRESYEENTLTPDQRMWLDGLEWCESNGNPNAINQNDGGSRSVGILQFKDATFAFFSKKYGLNYSPDDIWNPQKQRTLAQMMLADGLESHWTTCYHKLNEPYPKNTSSTM